MCETAAVSTTTCLEETTSDSNHGYQWRAGGVGRRSSLSHPWVRPLKTNPRFNILLRRDSDVAAEFVPNTVIRRSNSEVAAEFVACPRTTRTTISSSTTTSSSQQLPRSDTINEQTFQAYSPPLKSSGSNVLGVL